MTDVRIGTAGWAIPRQVAGDFPSNGSGLQRYAARLNAVEINSTFYRSHRPATLARWAETTPPEFRFAVKAPRAITHERHLADAADILAAFMAELAPLAGKLGPILVQLPPSLSFDAATAALFFRTLRAVWPGPAACEPRHVSWFEDGSADALLRSFHVARVAADPACHPSAATPGGWLGLTYWRLHGSPRMYYSAYEVAQLEALSQSLRSEGSGEVWCFFDNTTSGAAAANALDLRARMMG